MYTGIVTGTLVATVKDEALSGVPLLLVQKIEDGKPGDIIVAADQTGQAGCGDYVYMIGSKEAARIYRRGNIPVDVAIVGFIDSYNEVIPRDGGE